jgi:hypothetical protein
MIFKPREGSEPEAPALTETLRSQWNMALHQSSVRIRKKAPSNAQFGFNLTKYMDDLADGSRDWVVLHDMKFRWRERSAEVDHLLINRQLEILLVHARLLDRRTRCLNGKWEESRRNKHWEALPSPVEQCRRKLFVLRKLVDSERLAPHHHGVALPVSFKSLVLVDADFETPGNTFGDTLVWNLGTLTMHLRNAVPRAAAFFVTVPPEILEAFGQRLLAWHHHELPVAL